MDTKLKMEKADLKRRGFLMALGVGTASAAAVVVGAGTDAPDILQQAVKAGPGEGQGYAESRHVRNYYRTTRI